MRHVGGWHRTSQETRMLCGAALWVGIISLVFFVSVGQSLSAEKCIPRVGTRDLRPGEQFAGLYRIALDPPDFHDPEAVQRHLMYSTIWAHLVKDELSRRAGGLCGSFTTPYAFPDLRIFLIVRLSTTLTEQERSVCTLAMQDVLHFQPSHDLVTRAAASSALAFEPANVKEGSDAGILDQWNILQAVLRFVYDRNTLLHALMSVDATAYRSVNAVSFQSWLQRQKSSARVKVMPISFCLPATSDHSLASMGIDKLRDYSGIISPGPIQIPRKSGELIPPGPVRHMVIVGNPDGPRSSSVSFRDHGQVLQ